MKKITRPFSVSQKVMIALAFAAWLLLSGWAGECDRQDAMAYQPIKAEIVASSSIWAVTR